MTSDMKPLHLDAEPQHFIGNQGRGRYVILCGSRSRASDIGQTFSQHTVLPNDRGHDIHLGTISYRQGAIDVAAISTGMGCPSTEIILNELFMLGAKRFLRIGTAGSLQPDVVRVGDVVIASAAVRDESTSNCYLDPSIPAVASIDVLQAVLCAKHQTSFSAHVHCGLIHTKDAFYARECHTSDLPAVASYMSHLKASGVLATDMETSIIYSLTQCFNMRSTDALTDPSQGVKSASVVAIVGDDTPISQQPDKVTEAVARATELGLATVKQWFDDEEVAAGR